MVFKNSNWKTECIYDFYTVVEAKSIGILYKSETGKNFLNTRKICLTASFYPSKLLLPAVSLNTHFY